MKHGASRKGHETPTYRTWCVMRRRCKDVKYEHYPRYGGRGIIVCERWQTFENFLADMGERPPGMTLDRIDNDGNYEPGNCRWATRKQQSQNRTITRLLTVNGETTTIGEWARRVGLNPSVVSYRIDHGWPLDRALTEPPCVIRRGWHGRFAKHT